MIYNDFFSKILIEAEQNNRYRKFTNISRICGQFPQAVNNNNGHKITIWCSNDYLSLGQNEDSINNAKILIEKTGIGAGGTRNISGTSKEIVKLEDKIAKLHKKESSLVFTSGYIANEATINTLSKIIPNLIIFSDEENHASIIAGIKNSQLKKHVFRHNDAEHLEELLNKYDIDQPKIIIFESVYSMSGDFGKINEISNLAKKYNAMTMLDEVHAVAIYGQNGAGRANQIKEDNKIDIIQGTLGKGFGVVGGYIAANKQIIEAIRLTASSFIFTTAMPPIIAQCAFDNISFLEQNPNLINDFQDNVTKTKTILKEHNINISQSDSHIIPLIIGNAEKTKYIYQTLLEDFHIYLQNIDYPTVKLGSEMLRITPNILHNEEMIYHLAKSLQKVIH